MSRLRIRRCSSSSSMSRRARPQTGLPCARYRSLSCAADSATRRLEQRVTGGGGSGGGGGRDMRRFLQRHHERQQKQRRKHREMRQAELQQHAVPDDSHSFAHYAPWWPQPASTAPATTTSSSSSSLPLLLQLQQQQRNSLSVLLSSRGRSPRNASACAHLERAVQPPGATDFQAMISLCERSRAGALQAARILQRMRALYGVPPTVGCLNEFVRLCTELRSPAFLRWSDAAVAAVGQAARHAACDAQARSTAAVGAGAAADSGSADESERLPLALREYRYVVSRYILELSAHHAHREEHAQRIVDLFTRELCPAAAAPAAEAHAAPPSLVVDTAVAAALQLDRLSEGARIMWNASANRSAPRAPGTHVVHSLLSRCASQGLLSEALDVLAAARRLQYRPKSRDLVAVLEAAAAAATNSSSLAAAPARTPGAGKTQPYLSHQLLFLVFQRAVLAGCKVNAEVLVALARACARARPWEQRAERALAVLKEARRRRIKFTPALLQQVVLTSVAGGDVRRALAAYVRAAELHHPLHINVANALASLCLVRGNNRTAKAVFDDIAARRAVDSPPTAETLSLMVRYWAQVGNEERAKQGVQMIRTEAGLRPTETAYVALMRLAAEKGDVEAAMQWMRALERDLDAGGVVGEAVPSERAFRALFGALRKAAAVDTAFGLLSEYRARYNYMPSAAVYVLVLQTCVRAARMDLAQAVRKEMVARGMRVSEVWS